MASETPMQPAQDSAVAAVVTPPERADEIFLEGHARDSQSSARCCESCAISFAISRSSFVGPCVTVFGSARIKPDDPHYELALKMGAAIARLGFTVMTGGGQGGYGGGPTAAQKRSAAARFGCNVQLPFEESSNICLDRCVRLHYFFVRKALLIKYSYAFAVMLSGVGTLDELFEALALIRTRRSNIFRL